MQVNKVDPTSPAKSLVQGSIFKLDGLKFPYQGKGYSFNEFYPSVSSDGVRHGIVMSQSCDLVQEEPGRQVGVPYITIALLEPFHRYIRKEEDWSKVAMPWAMMDENGADEWHSVICSEKVNGVLGKSLAKLMQNNAKCHFFISFEDQDLDSRYYVANLTKAFPIQARHYGAILQKVSHTLKYEFARKLSWKIADLYGRADTEDYDADLAAIVSEELLTLTDRALKISRPIDLDKSEFGRAEKSKDSPTAEKTRVLHAIMKDRKAKAAQKAQQAQQALRTKTTAGSDPEP